MIFGTCFFLRFAANVHLHSEFFLPKGYVNTYNEVTINVGDRFDAFTGVFTAPHSGAYHFWFDSRTKHNIYVGICIRINGENDKCFSQPSDDDSPAKEDNLSGSTVVSLNAFDEVALHINFLHDSNENAVFGSEDHYFTFGGRDLP